MDRALCWQFFFIPLRGDGGYIRGGACLLGVEDVVVRLWMAMWEEDGMAGSRASLGLGVHERRRGRHLLQIMRQVSRVVLHCKNMTLPIAA